MTMTDCVGTVILSNTDQAIFNFIPRDAYNWQISIPQNSILPSFWVSSCIYQTNEYKSEKYNEFKRNLRDIMFPGEEIPEQYIGAVDDYAGRLSKLLPSEVEIDLEKELDDING